MKFFGTAVRSIIPETPQWEFVYSNWWSQGEEVTLTGTQEEMLKEQEGWESWGFSQYCSGYGPDRALTVYIGPKR